MSLSAIDTPVRAFMYENGRGGTSLGWASRIPATTATTNDDEIDDSVDKKRVYYCLVDGEKKTETLGSPLTTPPFHTPI